MVIEMIEKFYELFNKVKESFLNFIMFKTKPVDQLDKKMVILQKNMLVNRVLFITNIFVTVFVISKFNEITAGESISLLLPTFALNILLSYFVKSKNPTVEKQTVGMYIVTLVISYLAFRVYDVHQAQYTYVVIYYAVAVIALYQNKNVMILGDVLIFFIATYFHLNVIKVSTYELTVYTLFLLLYMIVMTAFVIVSENLDNERKKELEKRHELETEFNKTVNGIFNTIHEVNELNLEENDSRVFRVGLMAKKLAQLLQLPDKKCKEIFDYATLIGTERDFQGVNNGGVDIYKDYENIYHKILIGNNLIRRLNLSFKCDEMVRGRFEKWGGSSRFKKLKPEDSTIENQIVLLLDTYDNLRGKSTYKKSLVHSKAISEIKSSFSHFFDESILEVFFNNDFEFEIIFDRNNK